MLTDQIALAMKAFSGYDPNADGEPTIASLRYLAFEDPSEVIPLESRVGIVLVHPDLADPGPAGSIDLLPLLQRLKRDMRGDGLQTRFIRAQVYAGTRHQDGRTLLALRKFLQLVRASYDRLEGVLLIGDFPEAFLLGRKVMERDSHAQIAGKDVAGHILSVRGGAAAESCDLVLGDLEGGWEALYTEARSAIGNPIVAALLDPPSGPGEVGTMKDGATLELRTYEVRPPADPQPDGDPEFYADAFLVDDSIWTWHEIKTDSDSRLLLFIDTLRVDPEVRPSARSRRPNPIAIPTIAVSRLNARHVATRPPASIHLAAGETLVNDSGQPRSAQLAAGASTTSVSLSGWTSDPRLERQLLAQYLDRNHRFRTGLDAHLGFTASVVACNLPSGLIGDLFKVAGLGATVTTKDAVLLDQMIEWLKKPALLRGMVFHSGATSSEVATRDNPPKTATTAQVQAALGGSGFWWTKSGNSLVPTVADPSNAQVEIYRAIWCRLLMENSGPAFYFHGGCGVTSPNRPGVPYNDATYAPRQNAEGILFFLNGLALIGRAKVFNLAPDGATKPLAASRNATIGDAWKGIFEENASRADLAAPKDADLANDAKASYPWILIGDWTLKLRYQPALGLLDGVDFGSRTWHADHTSIDDWKLESANTTILGAGDLDGDGHDELLVQGSNGLGVLTSDGSHWSAKFFARFGTRLNGWAVGTDDRVPSIAPLRGPSQRDVMVASDWGFAVLAWRDGQLGSVVGCKNGTDLGGFSLDTTKDRRFYTGAFEGDGTHRILAQAFAGVAVLDARSASISTVAFARQGSTVDGWKLDTTKDRVRAPGRYRGADRAEFVVAGSQGLSLWHVDSGHLRIVAIAPGNPTIDGWPIDSVNDRFHSADVNGDGKDELVLIGDHGIAVFSWTGSKPTLLASLLSGKPLGPFMPNTAQVGGLTSFTDIDGQGKAHLLLKLPDGIVEASVIGNSISAVRSCRFGSRIGDWVVEDQDQLVVGRFTHSGGAREIAIRKRAGA